MTFWEIQCYSQALAKFDWSIYFIHCLLLAETPEPGRREETYPAQSRTDKNAKVELSDKSTLLWRSQFCCKSTLWQDWDLFAPRGSSDADQNPTYDTRSSSQGWASGNALLRLTRPQHRTKLQGLFPSFRPFWKPRYCRTVRNSETRLDREMEQREEMTAIYKSSPIQ